MHKMYDEIANWWPLLSPREEHAKEAEFFIRTISDMGLPDSPALLELGAGGGTTPSESPSVSFTKRTVKERNLGAT